MPEPVITFVYPIIRTDFIEASLETLYRFTENKKFRIIIVDQSLEGVEKLDWVSFTVNHGGLLIKMRNQGFAKAANEGIIHGLRWGTPYIAVVNDDTEFMYQGWLEDALSEFATDPRIIAVGPESPRVAMWGYGMTNGEYVDLLPYKDAYTAQDIAYLKSGDYSKEEIQSRYSFTIPEAFPFTKRGVIDGMAMWLPIFKREGLIECGLYDERFVWGGGEDYDWVARAYSCAWPIPRDECDERYHKRAVSTMKSWVWHHWGKSKDESSSLDPRLFEGREAWNKLGEIWTPTSDPWGHYTDENGVRRPNKRDPKVYIHIP